MAILPARGGSVRLPKKNIRPFFGRPIIAYSIATARESKLFDAIIVSTDDDEIAEVAQACGADVFMRAKDDGVRGTQEVTAEVLRKHEEVDFAACIYPCAPLMLPADLREGYFYATRVHHSVFIVSVGGDPLRDAGQWYFASYNNFLDKGNHTFDHAFTIQIPDDRVCDINTLEDFQRCEKMYEALRK